MSDLLYLKWTSTGRVAPYRRNVIPTRRWTTKVDNPIICERGWHACRWDDAVHHISDELWICRLDGPIVEGYDKVAGTRLRLVEQVTAIDDRALRLFAADCAADVLHLYESLYPNDDRPRKAIEAARAYANGEITSAARSAARSAAWSAARSAAESAAESAARSAAWSAARSAAESAAWSAARSAARSAAESAARSAAWSAAESAARLAAWSAARSAAWSVQNRRLLVDYAGLDPAQFAHREGP